MRKQSGSRGVPLCRQVKMASESSCFSPFLLQQMLQDQITVCLSGDKRCYSHRFLYMFPAQLLHISCLVHVFKKQYSTSFVINRVNCNTRCSPVVWCEVAAGHSQRKESWRTVFREELLHKLANIQAKVQSPGQALRVCIDFSNDLDHKTEEGGVSINLSIDRYTL